MGDELGDDWWKHESGSEKGEEPEEQLTQEPNAPRAEKRKKLTEKPAKKKKKTVQSQADPVLQIQPPDEKSPKPQKKRKKKKKTITDVLASSEPKPGRAVDLQNLLAQFFSDKRSVIEQEELRLQDSCFLSSNDLTHSLSSYLKQVCPKWSKIQKQHMEKSSVVLLIVCSSALRAIELIKQLTTFKGEAKVIKLFARHIKVEEQVKLLQKAVTHIGVGTPARISALIQRDGLSLSALRYLLLDWNWRDQKLRRMMDIPEVKMDVIKLLEGAVLADIKADKVKVGLF